jgi:serine/threonine-protein kinase
VAETLTQVGKYRIERELGRGAMGVVYKAFDPVVERMVAIKTIRLDVEDAAELVHRLRREAKSVGQLEHPNIVTLYDAGEAQGLFYLAMQFIQGETLHDRINRQRWFNLREVQDFFHQICAGLDYAHQRGVIHRDIKPANIMITPDGVVKLTDFGIAKVAGTGTTSTGLVVGTPSYMSPEQALGKPLDGRSDIFSLGSILYELMAGEKAFPGQNVTTVMYKIVHEPPTPLAALQPGLDPAVEGIVLKALAKRPEDRFQTCAELSHALGLYINQAIASMPKTSVAVTPPLPVAPPPSASYAAPPGTVPVAAPSSYPGVAPVAPAPSTGAPPVAGSWPPTGTQPVAPARAGIPLAWLGGGILGTLLLAILILLVIQMRQPAPVTTSPVTLPSGVPSTPAPATTPASTGVEPAAGPRTTQPPPSEEKPSPASTTASRPAPAPRESKPSTRPLREALRQPTREVTPSPPIRPTPAPTPVEPETFSSLVLKGDLAFQKGNYQDALTAYSKAYQMNPNSREVRRKIAVTLTLLGRPEEARKYQ